MYYLGIGLLVIGVTQGYILVEEEILIIIGSIMWVDAAGKLIKEGIGVEIEGKSMDIKGKYEWFLDKKREIMGRGIRVYKERVEIGWWYKQAQNYANIVLVSTNIGYFLHGFFLLEWNSLTIATLNKGGLVSERVYMSETTNISIPLKENNVYLNKYTTYGSLEKIRIKFTQQN